jgi:hypothetical protein
MRRNILSHEASANGAEKDEKQGEPRGCFLHASFCCGGQNDAVTKAW